MVTESVGSKGGNVNIINLRTASTTATFTEGAIIELNASGQGISCATNNSIKVIGVLVNALPGLSVAAQRNLAVQTNGIVTLNGWDDSTSGHQTSIVPGERVQVGQDSDTSWTGQVVVHALAAGGTTSDFNDDHRKPIGIAMQTVSTAGTRYPIKVLLTL